MNYSCNIWEFYQSMVFGKNHEGLGSVIAVRIWHFILFYSQQGIFPKSFIHIKEVTVEKRRYLSFFTRLDPPIAHRCLCLICFESPTWQMWISSCPFSMPTCICLSPFPHTVGDLIHIDNLFRSDSEGLLGSLENQTFHPQLSLNYIKVD